MPKKIEITKKQAMQFNQMLHTLKRIASYDSPSTLRKESEKAWGLDFEEALEMAYENVKNEARFGKNRVSPIKIQP